MDQQIFKIEKKVIVATENKSLGEQIVSSLDDMGWHIQIKSQIMDVIEKIRLNILDIVFVEKGFGGSGEKDPVLDEIVALPPSMRRKMLIVLLGDQWQSQDKKIAFSYSVDIVVNTKDIYRLKEIISMKLVEHSTSYKIFEQAYQEAGKV
ncbi:MAG: hypothetical protein ACMUJM_04300 [bacterium]